MTLKINFSILVSLEILQNSKLDNEQTTCQCGDCYVTLSETKSTLFYHVFKRYQIPSPTNYLSWNVEGTWSVVNGYKIRTLYSKNQQPKFICWGNWCCNPTDLSSAGTWVASWQLYQLSSEAFTIYWFSHVQSDRVPSNILQPSPSKSLCPFNLRSDFHLLWRCVTATEQLCEMISKQIV
jgi:hypothetical protein